MITMSDNTASTWLQKLVGGDYINNWLEANGFKTMRVNSRIPARRPIWAIYGWGVTTPREMCRLFTHDKGWQSGEPRGKRAYVPHA
jgi:beta-lactamase class A